MVVMKQKYSRKITVALVLASAALLAGCGNNGPVNPYDPFRIGAGGVPITSPVGFQAPNAQYSSIRMATGQATLMGGGPTYAVGGCTPQPGLFSRQMDFGQLSFTLQPAGGAAPAPGQPATYNYGNGSAAVTGTIVFSPQFQQYIQSQANAWGGFNQQNQCTWVNGQQQCNPQAAVANQVMVTGVSVDVSINGGAQCAEQRIVSSYGVVIQFTANGRTFSYRAQY